MDDSCDCEFSPSDARAVNAGQNKHAPTSVAGKSAAKLEAETEDFHRGCLVLTLIIILWICMFVFRLTAMLTLMLTRKLARIHKFTLAHACTSTRALNSRPCHTACACERPHIHAHAHARAHTHARTRARTHTHTHTHTHLQIRKHICAHAHTHVCMLAPRLPARVTGLSQPFAKAFCQARPVVELCLPVNITAFFNFDAHL